MLAKRIIPCLDVRDGRVVKGVSFTNLRDAGDPVALAEVYDREGADELVLLDISATDEGREATADVVRAIAAQLSIPLTVGGGISSVQAMERLLTAGAHRVSISTAAVQTPELIEAGAKAFGSSRIVVAIDAKYDEHVADWLVYIRGGKEATELRAREWAQHVESLGAGEILLTSIDRDGQKDGYDIPLTETIASSVNIGVIASGGAGEANHFIDVFTKGKAAAALAASIFHFQDVRIPELKSLMRQKGVPIRL